MNDTAECGNRFFGIKKPRQARWPVGACGITRDRTAAKLAAAMRPPSSDHEAQAGEACEGKNERRGFGDGGASAHVDAVAVRQERRVKPRGRRGGRDVRGRRHAAGGEEQDIVMGKDREGQIEEGQIIQGDSVLGNLPRGVDGVRGAGVLGEAQ